MLKDSGSDLKTENPWYKIHGNTIETNLLAILGQFFYFFFLLYAYFSAIFENYVKMTH